MLRSSLPLSKPDYYVTAARSPEAGERLVIAKLHATALPLFLLHSLFTDYSQSVHQGEVNALR